MAEDIYFDASHKFREPRKFKKSSYKPKGKEYKYIDPAEGLIQQVETKIVKPKRGKRAKRDMVDVDKKMVELLEKRRKIRKAREVGQTVDPDELKQIEALKERAIVPSVKMEMERESKEKEEKAQADDATRLALEEGRHQELIRGLKDIIDENIDLPMIYPPSDLLDDADPVPDKEKQVKEYQRQLNYLNLQDNKKLRTKFLKWLRDNNLFEKKYSSAMAKPVGREDEDAFRKRAHFILSNYRKFKSKTGKGLFGGKLLNLHPHLTGALISHDFIHRNANKILASLPAKHKGIKELEELKKRANKAVVMSNKMYGKGFGDFFKKMVNAGKTLKDVYDKIPDVVKKPLETKAKEAGRQQVQKASLYFQDKFKKK